MNGARRRRPYCPCDGLCLCYRRPRPGSACLNHRAPEWPVTLYERAEIVAANAAGFSAATIALRLGVSRSFVLAVLRARSPESDL